MKNIFAFSLLAGTLTLGLSAHASPTDDAITAVKSALHLDLYAHSDARFPQGLVRVSDKGCRVVVYEDARPEYHQLDVTIEATANSGAQFYLMDEFTTEVTQKIARNQLKITFYQHGTDSEDGEVTNDHELLKVSLDGKSVSLIDTKGKKASCQF